MQKKLNVLMFGPSLKAKSGISSVVNNWLEAGFDEKVSLQYISTLREFIPGRYVEKTVDAIKAYFQFIFKSLKHVDIVHIHFSRGMSFYRKFIIFNIAKIKSCKTAIHLHSGLFHEYYENGSSIQKWLIRSMIDRSDAMFVLSEVWRKYVQGITSNKNIYVLHNAVPIKNFSPKINNAENIIIATMGRLGTNKGTYDLLEAFRRLSKEIPQARLVLGGDGDIDKVKSIVKENNLSERVDVLGWVTGSDKIDVFRKADIYTLPSYSEGLPSSVLEAMAAGAPVVSTPVGGIPEAVIDSKNGYLIQPGDIDALYEKLLVLCKDPGLRERMSMESKILVNQKFNVEVIVDDLIKDYQEMMAR